MRHQVTASDHLYLPDALSFDFEFFVYSSIHLFPVHTYSCSVLWSGSVTWCRQFCCTCLFFVFFFLEFLHVAVKSHEASLSQLVRHILRMKNRFSFIERRWAWVRLIRMEPGNHGNIHLSPKTKWRSLAVFRFSVFLCTLYFRLAFYVSYYYCAFRRAEGKCTHFLCVSTRTLIFIFWNK